MHGYCWSYYKDSEQTRAPTHSIVCGMEILHVTWVCGGIVCMRHVSVEVLCVTWVCGGIVCGMHGSVVIFCVAWVCGSIGCLFDLLVPFVFRYGSQSTEQQHTAVSLS